MTDEQGPSAPPPPAFPPPPDHGPFANEQWPPAGPPGYGTPFGYGAPGAFYPLDIGRVFELTFSLFRFRWRTFVGLSLVVMVPLGAVEALMSVYSINSPDWYAQLGDVASGQPFDAYWKTLADQLPLSLALGAIIGVFSYVATGGLVDAISRTFSGLPASALGSLRTSLSRLGSFLGVFMVTFLANLAIVAVGGLLGSVMFVSSAGGGRIVPGPAVFIGLIVFVATAALLLFLVVRWSMAVQVVMIEAAGALQALRRSWHIVAGSTWRVIGYLLAFGLLVGLIAGVIGAFVTLLVNPIRITGLTQVSIDPVRYGIVTFVTGILSGALLPITTLATTLLYLDLRFRHGERVNPPGQGSIGEESVPQEQL